MWQLCHGCQETQLPSDGLAVILVGTKLQLHRLRLNTPANESSGPAISFVFTPCYTFASEMSMEEMVRQPGISAAMHHR
jgi:hypothetical protein